jgi:endonuclease III
VNFHRLLFKHGQQVCTWNHPKCTVCVLKDICDFGRSVLKIQDPMPVKEAE